LKTMCLTGVHLHILRRAVAKCAQGFIIPFTNGFTDHRRIQGLF